MKIIETKEGWQCKVEIYKDYVIKRFKTKKEIEKSVKEYYVKMWRDMKSFDKIVQEMQDDIIYSVNLLKRNNVPEKIIAFPEFLDDKTIKQKRVEIVGDRLESYHKSGRVKDWKNLLSKIIKFMPVLWEYGIHEKSFKFTSNFGILDDKIVLVDFLELEGNKSKVAKQLKKRKWANYKKINQKWRRYSDDLVDYFIEKADEVLTIEELNNRWRKRK